jgi:hypothetical protein
MLTIGANGNLSECLVKSSTYSKSSIRATMLNAILAKTIEFPTSWNVWNETCQFEVVIGSVWWTAWLSAHSITVYHRRVFV